MEIIIGKYKIRNLDARNIVIEYKQKPKKPGTENWAIWGYYGSLQGALQSLLHVFSASSDATVLKEVLTSIEIALNEIQIACKNLADQGIGVQPFPYDKKHPKQHPEPME